MKTTPVIPVIALAFAIFVAGYTFGTRRVHAPKKEAKPKPVTTNIVDNGLGAWLAETNHHFGSWAAKSLYVMQLPDGKFHIRFRDVNGTNAEFQGFFETDFAYGTANQARRMLSLNMDLRIKKATYDALENALK